MTRPGHNPQPSHRTLNDALVDPDTYAAGVEEGWDETSLYKLIVRCCIRLPSAWRSNGSDRRSR